MRVDHPEPANRPEPADRRGQPAADHPPISDESPRSSPDRLPDDVPSAAEYRATVDAVYRQYAIDQGCARVREIEEHVTSPAMHRIESEDPDRRLVGFDHRLKGEDRLTEKVSRQVESQPELTYEQAFTSLKDAIRYTFQYSDDHYTEGLHADSNRLKSAGFELVELRNTWTSDEYKGINSRWREPGTGQLFEVQFHTKDSFEAKQFTHPAYEKIRDPATPPTERDEMKSFQREVTGRIPVPRHATEIPNYP